ncbi:AAEL009046-PA [Aedes aegypti]|uniref:AAEL009046-PA n=1 Tax=Aedes aegypti TaxID=7159 RepID=Q16X03_AEDAE|nr:AAEL009046-PA [Aedes aegypti]
MDNSYTVHNSFELVADPVYYPITIGNEQFFLVQQDRRSIIDRRTWTVIRILPPTDTQPQPFSNQSNQNLFCQLIQQILASLIFNPCLTSAIERPIAVTSQPFKFHYERQTSTDDLCYFQRFNSIGQNDPSERKYVHFSADKSVNTDQNGRGQPMDCDPGEGTSSGVLPSFGTVDAYDLIKQQKERQGWFW